MRFVSLVLIIGLAVAIQVWSALQWTANFDSDEAIFGLMALHTLQGHPPTYRYGIPYLGSVESLLSAGFMYLFGNSVLVFRVSTLLLFAIFLILHGILIHGLWGWQVTVISLLSLVDISANRALWRGICAWYRRSVTLATPDFVTKVAICSANRFRDTDGIRAVVPANDNYLLLCIGDGVLAAIA
jgi:hypothetical protein